MSLKINVENVLADVSFVGNFSLLLMEFLTGFLFFFKVYFTFFLAACKDIEPIYRCYKALTSGFECRERKWQDGCELTCCNCDKMNRYMLSHIVFNQNFIKNETHNLLLSYKRGRT